MAGYTFFLRGFAPLGRETGLSLTHAFDRVTSASGYRHDFGERDGRVVLTLARDNDVDCAAIEIVAAAPIETDGEREVMALAADGRLGGFMAVPDADYGRYLSAPPAQITIYTIRFLVLAALRTHIHIIRKVSEMRTGHAKRMLDASVESLAHAVAQAIGATAGDWLNAARHKSVAEAD